MGIRGKTPFYPARLSKRKSREFITQAHFWVKSRRTNREGGVQNFAVTLCSAKSNRPYSRSSRLTCGAGRPVFLFKDFFMCVSAVALPGCMRGFSSCGEWGRFFPVGVGSSLRCLSRGAWALSVRPSVTAHGLSCMWEIFPDQGLSRIAR